MPVKAKPPPAVDDILTSVIARVRAKSRTPDIYGYKPHEKQIDFHTSTADTRLFIGGNRSGKTVGGAAEAVWYLLGKHPYKKIPNKPIYGRVAASDFIQGVAKVVMPQIQRWLPPSALINGSWEDSYNKQDRLLTLTNGNKLEFLSYDQDLVKFAGTSRDFCWLDEEPPLDIFQECMMRLLDVNGSMWLTLTPLDGITWMNEIVYEPGISGLDPTIHVTKVSTSENPHISEEGIEKIKKFYDETEMDARLHGNIVRREGLIYPNFTRENNVIDPIPNDNLNKDLVWACSLDLGWSNPTAVLWATVDKQGNITVFDELYKSNSTVNEISDLIYFWNKQHGKVPDYYVGDPAMKQTQQTSGQSAMTMFADNGIYIIPGINDNLAGYSRVRSVINGFRPNLETGERELTGKLRVTANCVKLISELQKLHYAAYASKRIASQNNAKETQHKKDDHAADSLRYMVMSRPEFMDNGTFVPDHDLEHAMSLIPHREAFEDGKRRAIITPNKSKYQYDEHLGEI